MNTLIVVAHPEDRSFCSELARRAADRLRREGEVRLVDLYAEDFDPVIRPSQFPTRASADRFEPMVEQAHQVAIDKTAADIADHQLALAWSDCLLLVFPLWWWSMPAMMKGWIDRVFSTDFAYGKTDLGGRVGMVCTTAETKAKRFLAKGGRNPLNHIERGILKFCGLTVAPSFVVSDIYDLSDGDRHKLLSDFEEWVALHLRKPGGGIEAAQK